MRLQYEFHWTRQGEGGKVIRLMSLRQRMELQLEMTNFRRTTFSGYLKVQKRSYKLLLTASMWSTDDELLTSSNRKKIQMVKLPSSVDQSSCSLYKLWRVRFCNDLSTKYGRLAIKTRPDFFSLIWLGIRQVYFYYQFLRMNKFWLRYLYCSMLIETVGKTGKGFTFDIYCTQQNSDLVIIIVVRNPKIL